MTDKEINLKKLNDLIETYLGTQDVTTQIIELVSEGQKKEVKQVVAVICNSYASLLQCVVNYNDGTVSAQHKTVKPILSQYKSVLKNIMLS